MANMAFVEIVVLVFKTEVFTGVNDEFALKQPVSIEGQISVKVRLLDVCVAIRLSQKLSREW